MGNTSINSNKDKTEGIAKMFLPYEREYNQINAMILRMNLIFSPYTRGETFKRKLSTFKGKKFDWIRKTRCCPQREIYKSKKCNMKYIVQTGRQRKCRIKEHKVD